MFTTFSPQLKDFKRAEKALDAFISVQSMTTLSSSELKKKMDTVDNLAYPLLQWYGLSCLHKLAHQHQVTARPVGSDHLFA